MSAPAENSLLPLYQTLWQLTRRQAEAIDAGSLEELSSLIVQRQAIMEEIDRRSSEGAHLGTSPRQLRELLEQISALNQENARKLVQRMDQLKEQTAMLRQGRRGVQSYEAVPEYEPKFIDRRQ